MALSFHVADLPWLPLPGQDFRAKLRRLRELYEPKIARELAGCRLNVSQLHALGTELNRLTDGVKLGVISNGTVDLALPALAVSCLRHGVGAQVIGADFGQVAQVALDPNSTMNRARCDYVLLALDHRGLPLSVEPGNAKRGEEAVLAGLAFIDSLRSGLRAASDATVIVQTLPQPALPLFGSLDRALPGSLAWVIEAINRELRATVHSSGDLLLDAAALAETVGLSEWNDPVHWNLGKFLHAQRFVLIYADWVGRLLAAARGTTRKCLVLDLDNTLWGGVIGDDGLEGIVLGQSDPTGEAYLAVQQLALRLRARGIVLAVASKNELDTARSPFLSHPEMLLKETDIAVFQANWQTKSDNLVAIARALNIGTDALVLLDDNPAERAQVRQTLPEVAVPELPEDPAYFATTLSAAGYFESVRLMDEDLHRAEQYQANSRRAELLASTGDMSAYLRSLAMVATFAPFDSVGRGRITQLINKTNQFNLTTRRYTESQVQQLEETAALALQIRLTDTFGDNGMVAVVICVAERKTWFIDTWLMSCRVLGRQLEEATLNVVVECARRDGVTTLVGRYVPTERNDLVRQHYKKLGFVLEREEGTESVWRLSVADYVAHDVQMTVDTRPLHSNDAS